MVTKAEIKKVMSALGKKTSPAKAAAARRNAKLGGRPKKRALSLVGTGAKLGLSLRDLQKIKIRDVNLTTNELVARKSTGSNDKGTRHISEQA